MNVNPNPERYPGDPRLLKHIEKLQVWHECSWCPSFTLQPGLGPVEAEAWFKDHMRAVHPAPVPAKLEGPYEISLTLKFPGYGIDEQAISTMAELLKIVYYTISRKVTIAQAEITREGTIRNVNPEDVPITYN